MIDDTPIVVRLDTQDVTLVLAQSALSIQIPEPVEPILVIPTPPALAIAIPAPTQPVIQIIYQTVEMAISLSQGWIQGPRGEKGETGQRGSLLLGLYGSADVLPVPTNDGLFPGDYAFDAAGTLYQIQE